MRAASIFIAVCFAAVPGSVRAQEHHHALTDEEVGSVHFATSCAQPVEKTFDRGVALLHSFQYEKSRAVFSEVAEKDPQCAMAEWGIAMSHYHGLWENSDLPSGRVALRNAEKIVAENLKTTTREKAYIEGLAEIYREDGKSGVIHAQEFEKKMGALQAAYPNDTEAAIFHALVLDITASKMDKTFANQKRCGEILQPIFATHSHHPGVAHYLIHCYDNPVLAQQGLTAARAYAKVAPASAHANHMPSHIFTRVGSWDESIASNKTSAELAANDEKTSHGAEPRDQRLHAMDYMEYAYLQSGRVKQAELVQEEMNALKPVAGLTVTGDYALAAIPARYAIELKNWNAASELKPHAESVSFAQAITWAAIGVGSARLQNLERAAEAEKALSVLRDATIKRNDTYWANQVEVQRREVAAWLTQANGKPDDAVAAMRSAAELEESMDKAAVTPGPVIPAREMLAELLAINKHSQAALAEYEAVLQVAPNRFNALYGAATSAEAAGNASAASGYFQKLTQIAIGEERPELVDARKKAAVTAKN
jgi:tetratricopeptide (TPR) repeat protein